MKAKFFRLPRFLSLLISLQFRKKISPSGDFHSNENHRLLAKSLFPPPTKKRISIWSQRTENQKYAIEENVMSEQVKIPNRHFLRRDYLHIFFYLKFLVFVSLVPQISIYFPGTTICIACGMILIFTGKPSGNSSPS